MITLHRFTRDDNPPAFLSYRRVKYDVFALEQGWPLGGDGQSHLADEDAVDPVSCFALARDPSGRDVGIVRGTMLDDAFPHRDYLEHHLRQGGIRLSISKMATVNSLAVVSDLRGKPTDIAGRSDRITVGKALMCEIADWCRQQGALAVIFTTIQHVPAIFFAHLGAYVMDAPFRPNGVDLDLVNMTLLTTDPERFREQGSPLLTTCPDRPLTTDEQLCKSYCQSCHTSVVGDQTIEQFVGLG